ncbi:hypothetical protein MMC20_007536 [Loxospora ochrophaea]|nr:hypothetical protein [Loxospora ochrophaea]
MPVANADLEEHSPPPLTRLPFPPLTKSHILNTSYHSWYPRYRSVTPKARLIPLSPPFISYLRSDGIILPPETAPSPLDDSDSGVFSSSFASDSEDDDNEENDPSLQWQDIHQTIRSTILELGGSVVPKLNWSAPKDATWIAATNSMECHTPNDIYLLLKSSDFVTHDLEHALDGCEDAAAAEEDTDSIPYHLVLRKTIPSLITSLELRCFVRARRLLCICQRDLNHYSFLPSLLPRLRALIQDFFDAKLRDSFPDDNFVFDVYVPQPQEKGRVWLIDVNPWAARTDPLLFSWLEVLTMRNPSFGADGAEAEFVRLSLQDRGGGEGLSDGESGGDETETETGLDVDEATAFPEFRLVNRDDPEAYSFNTPQYSAHKLPKDVVDAGSDGEAGLREFMGQWRDIVSQQEKVNDDEDENGVA